MVLRSRVMRYDTIRHDTIRYEGVYRLVMMKTALLAMQCAVVQPLVARADWLLVLRFVLISLVCKWRYWVAREGVWWAVPGAA